jgi:hypothetical protein
VIAAVIRCGPASISTRAMTPSTSTEVTVPVKRFLAEKSSPTGWRSGCGRNRSTSATDTRRLPDLSRFAFSFPALSQRRAVSTLIPRALAASPMDMSFAIRRQSTRIGIA